ncbi:MAG TPA: hypothetical protein VH108_02985 [Gaiellaceae bacterium]|jgi:hypothetical protein|nr:hypothetical protein [Gaiellaceae bacterium]
MKRSSRSLNVLVAALAVALGIAALATIASAGSGSSDSRIAAANATAQFHDLTVAKQAGYRLLKDKRGIACIAMDSMPAMGAMGVHYAKSSLVADGKLKVTAPEALVYRPLAGGKLQLAALEYVVLKSAWDAHHASPPSLFGQRFNFTPAGNRFGLPAYYSLHAWFWQQNPAGLFAMWNPRVSCK